MMHQSPIAVWGPPNLSNHNKNTKPKFRKGPPKNFVGRFYRLKSGRAMMAHFLRDKWKRIEIDTCWWCDKNVRQNA